MLSANLEQLRLPPRPAHPATTRLWREWCFVRAIGRHIAVRLAVMLAMLLVGAMLFRYLEPDKQHDLPRAMYYTWALVFAQAPEEFPASPVLRGLFFIVPVIGLVVILEGLVDCAMLVRDRRRYERSWCKVMSASLKDHVILVGLGKLGYRAFRLLRQLGQAVVVIERNPENQFLEDIRREGCPLFVGDARREAVLVEAHVAAAKSIILATNHDLVNLECALDARKINPKIRVVLRMFDQNMADKVHEGFDIELAMSQSAISAPAFVMAAIEESLINCLVIDDELVVMQRWFVRPGQPLCGKTVGTVTTEYGVGIVERRPREGTPRLMPPPHTLLEDGDELLVQGTYEVLTQMRERTRELTVGA